MKKSNQLLLTQSVRYLILVIMVLTVAVVATLPYIVDWYLKVMNITDAWVKNVLLITLYPCGILAFLTELEMYLVFLSLSKNDPFVVRNVKGFMRIGVYMLGIAAALTFKVFTVNSLMTMLGALGFVVVGLLMFVLSDVFRQAVAYKRDNDLTI